MAEHDPLSEVVRLVDLAAPAPDWLGQRLPPCPVIGFGQESPDWQGQVDALADKPATLAAMQRGIRASPNSAAIAAQLLRLLPTLELQQGLVLESIAYGLLQAGAEHRRWQMQRPRGLVAPPGHVLVERVGAALSITLDRAASFNAIDRAMRDELYDAFFVAALDPEISAVTLGATGRTFSVGADLGEFGTTRDPVRAHAIRTSTLPAHAILGCRDRLRVSVQGACIGSGLEMAAFAAHITASPGAWFQLPELAMGLIPGAGGCVSLCNRIGRQRTARLIFSGERLRAETALDWGLIDAIEDD